MSLRRKYPNNKAGRKQRRVAEAACASADTLDVDEGAETKKRKAPAVDDTILKFTEQFIAVPSVDTGEHALALYDAAEARLKSNMKSMSDVELKECRDKLSFMVDLLDAERARRL